MSPNNPFDRMPESEKLRIVDEALNDPGSPIPQKAVPFLRKEHKLDLFNRFVEGGAISYERYTPPQPKAPTPQESLPKTFDEMLDRLPPTRARRLLEIKSTYGSFDAMPGKLQVEVHDIMTSACNTPSTRKKY